MDELRMITDFTEGGKCSNCGQCCSGVLPMTQAEVDRIKRYVRKHGIREQRNNGRTGADMTCPFRDERNRKCLIYSARPAICREFVCNHTQEDIRRAKLDFHGALVVYMRKEFFENTEQTDFVKEYIAAIMEGEQAITEKETEGQERRLQR